MPVTPEAVAITEGSGERTNDHSTKNAQNNVHTVMNTMWKLRSDIMIIYKRGNQR